MATVAWDGKTLATDRMVIIEGEPLEEKKLLIFNILTDDGEKAKAAFAAVGDIDFGMAMATNHYYGKLITLNRPEGCDAWDAIGIFVEKNEGCSPVAYMLLANGRTSTIDHKSKIALGSGAKFAYGAMDAGCDAVRAVEIAIGRDPFSGFGVDSFTP